MKTLTKLSVVLFLAGVVFAGLGGDNSVHAAEIEQPNILFILVDDLGSEWISCYGSESIETPHVDAWCMWTGYEAQNPPSGQRYWNPYIYTDKTPSKTYKDQFGPDIYADYLIDFMKRHKDEPMLVYFPMALTHVPRRNFQRN